MDYREAKLLISAINAKCDLFGPELSEESKRVIGVVEYHMNRNEEIDFLNGARLTNLYKKVYTK